MNREDRHLKFSTTDPARHAVDRGTGQDNREMQHRIFRHSCSNSVHWRRGNSPRDAGRTAVEILSKAAMKAEIRGGLVETLCAMGRKLDNKGRAGGTEPRWGQWI